MDQKRKKKKSKMKDIKTNAKVLTNQGLRWGNIDKRCMHIALNSGGKKRRKVIHPVLFFIIFITIQSMRSGTLQTKKAKKIVIDIRR